MIYVFAGVTLALAVCALANELRPGGSLFPGFDDYYDDEQRLGVLYELPVPDGWEPEEIALVLAEIEAL